MALYLYSNKYVCNRVSLQGTAGADGLPGPPGNDGIPGAQGRPGKNVSQLNYHFVLITDNRF